MLFLIVTWVVMLLLMVTVGYDITSNSNDVTIEPNPSYGGSKLLQAMMLPYYFLWLC